MSLVVTPGPIEMGGECLTKCTTFFRIRCLGASASRGNWSFSVPKSILARLVEALVCLNLWQGSGWEEEETRFGLQWDSSGLIVVSIGLNWVLFLS